MPWIPLAHDARLIAYLIVAGAALYVLRRFGILPTSPTEGAAIVRADRAEGELKIMAAENAVLKRERSLVEVLKLLERIAQDQHRVLEKLAELNGSLSTVDDGLRHATEGLKLVTGLIVGTHDAEPAKPQPRRQPARRRRTA